MKLGSFNISQSGADTQRKKKKKKEPVIKGLCFYK